MKVQSSKLSDEGRRKIEDRSSEGGGIYTLGGRVKVSEDHFCRITQPITRKVITISPFPSGHTSLKVTLYIPGSLFWCKLTYHAESTLPQDHQRLGSTHHSFNLDHPRLNKDQ